MNCAYLYLPVFIQNRLMHLAEKIQLLQPITFGMDYRPKGQISSHGIWNLLAPTCLLPKPPTVTRKS